MLDRYFGKPRAKTGSTPPPEVPVKRPESRKATQMDQEIIRDIQTGFNAVNFLSFALLKCAVWLSKSEVWQSVQALLDPGVNYAFADGRWGLRGVQTQPKRLPRVALPILDQCYDANGNPLIFRKVCLLQPKLSTFASVRISWLDGIKIKIKWICENFVFCSGFPLTYGRL